MRIPARELPNRVQMFGACVCVHIRCTHGKHNIILINMICDSESVSQCHCQGGCPLGISNERPPPPPTRSYKFSIYARSIGMRRTLAHCVLLISHTLDTLSARSCCTRLVCGAACAPWDALRGHSP